MDDESTLNELGTIMPVTYNMEDDEDLNLEHGVGASAAAKIFGETFRSVVTAPHCSIRRISIFDGSVRWHEMSMEQIMSRLYQTHVAIGYILADQSVEVSRLTDMSERLGVAAAMGAERYNAWAYGSQDWKTAHAMRTMAFYFRNLPFPFGD